MRVLLMVACVVMLAGCGRQVRTGSICTGEFTTLGFRTSNPVEVTQSVVNSVRDEIPYEFKRQIEAETWFKFEPDCKKADYVISGKVTMVNTAIRGQSAVNIFGLIGTDSTRTFGVGVESIVTDNKTSKIMSTYSGYKEPAHLDDTLYYLSRKITDDVKYEPKDPAKQFF